MVCILHFLPPWFEPATVQVLNSHMWLMATMLDRAGLEHWRKVGSQLGFLSFLCKCTNNLLPGDSFRNLPLRQYQAWAETCFSSSFMGGGSKSHPWTLSPHWSENTMEPTSTVSGEPFVVSTLAPDPVLTCWYTIDSRRQNQTHSLCDLGQVIEHLRAWVSPWWNRNQDGGQLTRLLWELTQNTHV